MFNHGLDRKTSNVILLHWLLLSFLSGSVNAGGYLACSRFVTHVTGFATLFGADMAEGNWAQGFAILSLPVYFLFGTMVSAFLVDRRSYLKKKPSYGTVMLLVAGLLLLAALGGHFHFFGFFGARPKMQQDYLLLVLLCCASGLQNAAITTSSIGTVRTTHLTGVTTDLGIGIVRTFYMQNPEEIDAHAKANFLRLGTIVFFILGSIVGAILFLHYQYLGFLMPFSLALYAAFVAYGNFDPTSFHLKDILKKGRRFTAWNELFHDR